MAHRLSPTERQVIDHLTECIATAPNTSYQAPYLEIADAVEASPREVAEAVERLQWVYHAIRHYYAPNDPNSHRYVAQNWGS